MKVVIFGLSRTGTSALFYKLKGSMAANTICLFEATSRGWIDRLRVRLRSALTGQGERDELAKILPFRTSRPVRLEDFARFHKQVLLVRDPRDRLISALLYRIYNSDLPGRPDAVAEFVRILKAKEAAPGSVPVTAIVQSYADLEGETFSLDAWLDRYAVRAIQQPIAFEDEHPDVYRFHYEDMVADRYSGLETYLGIKVTPSAPVGHELYRVKRTGSSGSWRDWFTAEDVRLFAPVMQPYLDRHYSGADWTLAAKPTIDPEHGSRYVEKVSNEKRRMLGLSALRF